MAKWILVIIAIAAVVVGALALPTPYQAQERRLALCQLRVRQNDELHPASKNETEDEAETSRIISAVDTHLCMLAAGYRFTDKAPCPDTDKRPIWGIYYNTMDLRCYLPQTWLKRQIFLEELNIREPPSR